MNKRWNGWICFLMLWAALAVGCGGGGGGGGDNDSPANAVPLASAGLDQRIHTGSQVTLDGSGSTDANGDLLAFFWVLVTKPTGSQAVLSSSTAVKPTFTADVDGDYIFALVVTDGVGESLEDLVTVSATSNNSPPVANAGPNQTVAVNSTVTLDGTASSDADLDQITYFWTLVSKPAGSGTFLSNATVPRPFFVADKEGQYTATLVVNDGLDDSAEVTVTVEAVTGNVPPVADAGPDQNVTTGSTVTLDGTGSHDDDLDAITYLWSFSSRPSTSAAALSDTTASSPTFEADADGTYVLSLVVNDGVADSSADTVTVTAASGNSAPNADAGVNKTVTTGSTVTLMGNSSDPDGDIITYSWSITSKPTGSAAVLSNTSHANPEFLADVSGDYVIQLIVSDGFLNSNPDSVTITAQSNRIKWIRSTGDAVTYPPKVGPSNQINVVANYFVHSFLSDGTLDFEYSTWFHYLGEANGVTPFAFDEIGNSYVGFDSGEIRLFDDYTQNPLMKNFIYVQVTPGSEITVYGQRKFLIGSSDHALFAYNGSVMEWFYPTGGPAGTPIVGGDGTIYFGAKDNKFYALNSNGTLKWSVSFAGGGIGKPALGPDGTIYVTGLFSGTSKKELVALNPDGTHKWTFNAATWVGGTPVLGSDGTIYTVSEGSTAGGLYAVNPTGTQKWLFSTGLQTHSSPVLTPGGSVLVASGSKVISISVTGTQDWSFSEIQGTIVGAPAVGSDGTIYVGTTSSKLYALKGSI